MNMKMKLAGITLIIIAIITIVIITIYGKTPYVPQGGWSGQLTICEPGKTQEQCAAQQGQAPQAVH